MRIHFLTHRQRANRLATFLQRTPSSFTKLQRSRVFASVSSLSASCNSHLTRVRAARMLASLFWSLMSASGVRLAIEASICRSTSSTNASHSSTFIRRHFSLILPAFTFQPPSTIHAFKQKSSSSQTYVFYNIDRRHLVGIRLVGRQVGVDKIDVDAGRLGLLS